MDIIQREVSKAICEHDLKIEEYIKLRIRTKPKLLPIFIWHLLLKRFLVLERFGMEVKNG
ncbi:MAG: hypothetical protein KAW92_09645 [Candidatus Cloacimonetes bacterium]|nr:hypothetical protein [Candidatus Cloacimonadota bacterium]